jgi:hypothetical protein
MGATGVYLVRFHVPGSLTVDVDGEQVPMDQFVKTHTPIQVTGLTHVPQGDELKVVGLIIAAGKKKANTTW